ncbi:MAG: DNA mismatch repair endonuclease MutH [Myxococcales bacterium]|nr:MAG: DNA mismatch repair endonuclease MutH [Myxococcales bacterium]
MLYPDRAKLLDRAQQMVGMRVGEIAERSDMSVPKLRDQQLKGMVGSVIERFLGVEAGNAPHADFPELGVELKTIPVNAAAKPTESTFVATAPLDLLTEQEWQHCSVWKKLQCVLWVPIEADKSIPLVQRRVGRVFLWEPSEEQAALLRDDWEDIMGQMILEGAGSVSAHLGKALQLRPKGTNAAARRVATDVHDAPTRLAPRAFYLRTSFTKQLINTHI